MPKTLGYPNSYLGDYWGGHPIPYKLTDAEVQEFLARHTDDQVLQDYLLTKSPAWGITVDEATYGTMLVWFDFSNRFHVIDVTGLSIVDAVNQAAFESPDSSLIDNLLGRLQTLVESIPQGVSSGLSWAVGIAVLFLLFEGWKAVKAVKS